MTPWRALAVTMAIVLAGAVLVSAASVALLVTGGRRGTEDTDAVVVGLRDDLARCFSGTSGSRVRATVVLRAGVPILVAARDGDVTAEEARCMVDLLGSAAWPAIDDALDFPIHLR